MRGGETHIQLVPNPSGAGYGFELFIDEQISLMMALNPGLTVSLITPDALDSLQRASLVQNPARRGPYRLAHLTVDGQPLPDLDVYVSRRVARLRVDGVIGLDLLLRFEHVHLHVPTLHLILQNPTNGHLRS